jgi:hypothetical protein
MCYPTPHTRPNAADYHCPLREVTMGKCMSKQIEQAEKLTGVDIDGDGMAGGKKVRSK